MLGKGPTQLLRLSGILQALHDAFDYVMNTSTEKFELTINFSNDLQVFLETNPLKIISIDNVNRAYKLLEYFNKHKLVLAGYEIDINDDIKDIFIHEARRYVFMKVITKFGHQVARNNIHQEPFQIQIKHYSHLQKDILFDQNHCKQLCTN